MQVMQRNFLEKSRKIAIGIFYELPVSQTGQRTPSLSPSLKGKRREVQEDRDESENK